MAAAAAAGGAALSSWIGPAIGAGAGLLGNFLSQSGQQSTNAMNMAMMQQNEAWQERMSDTAMQRRVTDLQQAGLNPLLAVNTPGAAMPSFQQPTLQNPNQSFAGLGDQVTSALQTANLLKQGAQIDAQATAATADAREKNADAAIKEATGPFAAAQAAATVDNLHEMRNQIISQTRKLDSDFDVNTQNVASLMQQRDFAARLFPIQQQIATYEAQAKRYGLPELRTQAQFWSSPTAAATYAAQEGAKAAGPVGAAINAAPTLSRAIQQFLTPPESWSRFVGAKSSGGDVFDAARTAGNSGGW